MRLQSIAAFQRSHRHQNPEIATDRPRNPVNSDDTILRIIDINPFVGGGSCGETETGGEAYRPPIRRPSSTELPRSAVTKALMLALVVAGAEPGAKYQSWPR